jgi:hypothetical protein
MLMHGSMLRFPPIEFFGPSASGASINPLRRRANVSPDSCSVVVEQRLSNQNGGLDQPLLPQLSVCLAAAIRSPAPTRGPSRGTPLWQTDSGSNSDSQPDSDGAQAQALAFGLQHHCLDGGLAGSPTESALRLSDYALDLATAHASERLALEAAAPHLLPPRTTRGTKKRAQLSGAYGVCRPKPHSWQPTKPSCVGFRPCATAGRCRANKPWCLLPDAMINASSRWLLIYEPASARSGKPATSGKRTSRPSCVKHVDDIDPARSACFWTSCPLTQLPEPRPWLKSWTFT